MNGAGAPTVGPDAETLRRLLAEVGDATQAALHELCARPSLERANRALVQLQGAREAVLRYRAELTAEGADGR